MASLSSSTANHNNKEVTMPELSEIKGRLNIEGLICSLAINQAIEEIQKYKDRDDELSSVFIEGFEKLLLDLVDQIEPIEE